MQRYGRSWTKISSVMKTRTEPQVRSHAQKHFLRVNRQSKAAEAARPGGADGDDGGLAADGDALDGEGKPRREPAPNATAGLGGPDQTREFSSSVTAMSIRLIFGRLECSRRVLEARPKDLRRNGRLRAH